PEVGLMKILVKNAFLAFWLMSSFSPAGLCDQKKVESPAYAQAYDEITHLQADPAKAAVVSHLVIRRDVATFSLEDGTLYLCRPVLGQSGAALFHGHGTFSYSPPGDIEKNQLARYYDKKTLNESFTVLLLIFADSTLDELAQRVTFAPQDVPKGTEAEL